MLLSNKILFTGCYFVTFINFVHRPSHILCVFFIIPLYCMHVRMSYVLIKEPTYLLTCYLSKRFSFERPIQDKPASLKIAS